MKPSVPGSTSIHHGIHATDRAWRLAHPAVVVNPRAMTHVAKTSSTPVGNGTDSPEPILRPSPVTGHNAEILEVDDPDLGYDVET
jgi:hypothetical protein